MTAAHVMDIRTRLPGCSGQAADAVSAYTEVKMEDASTLVKIPEAQMAQIMVQYGRSSRSPRKEFVRSPFGRTILGKAI